MNRKFWRKIDATNPKKDCFVTKNTPININASKIGNTSLSLQPENKTKMVTQLIIVWAIAVVSFFALWALLTSIFHKISARKGEKTETLEDENAADDSEKLEKNP